MLGGGNDLPHELVLSVSAQQLAERIDDVGRRGDHGNACLAAQRLSPLGKGLDDDDPVEHLFVTSTHDYLLFFTNRGGPGA